MAVLSMKEMETMQRALGIIEGIAIGLTAESAKDMLYTALEMMDSVIDGGKENG